MTNQTVALGVIEYTWIEPETVATATPDRVHRVIGNAGSTKRAVFLQRIAGRLLRSLALCAIVVALSDDWLLGAVVGLAEVVLTPLLNRAVASAWRHWRHTRANIGAVGTGR